MTFPIIYICISKTRNMFEIRPVRDILFHEDEETNSHTYGRANMEIKGALLKCFMDARRMLQILSGKTKNLMFPILKIHCQLHQYVYLGIRPIHVMGIHDLGIRVSYREMVEFLQMTLLNANNGGTYLPLAFINVTTLPMIERPLLSGPSC